MKMYTWCSQLVVHHVFQYHMEQVGLCMWDILTGL